MAAPTEASFNQNLREIIRLSLTSFLVENEIYPKNILGTNLFYKSDDIQSRLMSDGGSGVKIPIWKRVIQERQLPYDATGVVPTAGELETTAFTAVLNRYELKHKISYADLDFASSNAGIAEAEKRFFEDSIYANNLNIFLETVVGMFESDHMMTNHVWDLSSTALDDKGLMKAISQAARKVLGDQHGKIKVLMMHSALAQRLIDENTDTTSGIVVNSQVDLVLSTYRGYKIIENDSIPFDTETGIGSIYMLGENVFGTGEGRITNPVQVYKQEAERTITTQMSLSNLCHPYGFSFVKSMPNTRYYPTAADLKDGTNWEAVLEQKNLPYVHLLVKIDD